MNDRVNGASITTPSADAEGRLCEGFRMPAA